MRVGVHFILRLKYGRIWAFDMAIIINKNSRKRKIENDREKTFCISKWPGGTHYYIQAEDEDYHAFKCDALEEAIKEATKLGGKVRILDSAYNN